MTSDAGSASVAPHVGASVRSAMVWNAASMTLSQVALSAIFIILANRLDPHVFGLFGLAAVFVDFFYGLGASSGVDALLLRQDFSRRTLSTAFWCLTAAAAAVTTAILLAAPLVAGIAGDPDALLMLVLLALTLVPMPLSLAPTALMRQKLDFRGVAIRNMLASLIGGLAALAVAFSPWAIWALVVQRWVQLIVSTATVLIHTRAFPAFQFDRSVAFPYMASAGRIFTAQSVGGAAPPRVFDLLIAVYFGVVILGCVRVASKLLELITSALVNPIGQMWIILVSRAGAELEQRRAIFLQLTQLTALVALPGYVGTALIASEFTHLALAPAFAPVALCLAVMAATQILVPLSNFRNGLFTSLNRLNLLIVFGLMDLVFMCVAIVAFEPLGLTAVLVAAGFCNVFSLCFSLPLSLKDMGAGAKEFVKGLLPPYTAALGMVVAVWAFQASFPQLGLWALLAGKIATGALAYVGVLALIFRRWSLGVVVTLKNRSAVIQ